MELPDLNRLTNDPINYAPWWPVIPHKLPSDIPKFNGNPGEDPSTHVMTYHLWCSSNSLNDDFVRLPFVATVELLDLNRLTNDPINYAPWWPVIPHKLPSDIPKFDGNPGEDPSTHVMTYHLWCSSNSLNDDSIRLRLFQHMLTGLAAKWYTELPRASFDNFTALVTIFLTHL